MVPPNLPGSQLSPTKILLPFQSSNRGFRDPFTVAHAPPVSRETIYIPIPSVSFVPNPSTGRAKKIAFGVVFVAAVFLLLLGEYVRRKAVRQGRIRGRGLGLRLGNRNQDQNMTEGRGEGNAPPAQIVVTHPPALRLGSRQEHDGIQPGSLPTQSNYTNNAGLVGGAMGAHPDSRFKPDGNAVTFPPSSVQKELSSPRPFSSPAGSPPGYRPSEPATSGSPSKADVQAGYEV